MQIKEKKVQKFLSKKIQQLNNIVADLDSLVTEIGSDYFRVSIFGSARMKTSTNEYIQVYNLAKKLAQNNIDAGISILRSGPTNNRTIWGTINPTKPMGPQVATTVPVMRDAVTNPIFCIFLTFTHRLEAE